MSHELRTPINAIIGYTDLLLVGAYGELAEKQTEGVNRAHRAAQHLLELVNDVLDLSKLEAGKLEMSPEPVRLPELVQDLFTTVSPLAEGRGSELRMVSRGCEEPILTDPRRRAADPPEPPLERHQVRALAAGGGALPAPTTGRWWWRW